MMLVIWTSLKEQKTRPRTELAIHDILLLLVVINLKVRISQQNTVLILEVENIMASNLIYADKQLQKTKGLLSIIPDNALLA